MNDSVRISEALPIMENVIVAGSAVELAVISLICNGMSSGRSRRRQDKRGISSAKSINTSFRRIQFTPDILPSDITRVFDLQSEDQI